MVLLSKSRSTFAKVYFLSKVFCLNIFYISLHPTKWDQNKENDFQKDLICLILL